MNISNNLDNENIPNEIISNKICDNENIHLQEYETHYIYIADSDTHKYIEKTSQEKDIYIVENQNETNIIDQIANTIQQLCNKRNIVIYILLPTSSQKKNKFIYLFNKFLANDLSDDKYYSNIIIISFFEPTKLPRKDVIYFSTIKNLLVANIENKFTNSKKLFKVLNVYCNRNLILKPIVDKLTLKPNDKILTYQFMNSDNLYDYNEVKSLLIQRRCSTGKLIQFTGTCWVNSILNALLLPKNLRLLMIEQCKSYISDATTNVEKKRYKMDLYDIYVSRFNLNINHIIASIVYNIFIKKKRLDPFSVAIANKEDDYESNFILVLADKLKREWFNNDPSRINLYLKTKFIKYLKSNDVRFGDNGSIHMIIDLFETIVNNLYFNNFTHKIKFIKLSKKQNDNKENILKTLIIDNVKYKLTSCILTTNKHKHAICGFICENKEFIYNSNLQNAIETNWSDYNYSNYKQYITSLKYENEYYEENTSIILIHLLIYVIDEEKDNIEIEINEQTANIPNIPCTTDKQPSKKTCKNTHELIDGRCLKKCNETQVRSQTTKRCVKYKPPTATKVPSQPPPSNKKKCNEETHEIIDGRCLKQCNETQVRNQTTKRCIKINTTRKKTGGW